MEAELLSRYFLREIGFKITFVRISESELVVYYVRKKVLSQDVKERQVLMLHTECHNISQILIRNQRNGHCLNTYVTNILTKQVTMRVISVYKLSRYLWNNKVMMES